MRRFTQQPSPNFLRFDEVPLSEADLLAAVAVETGSRCANRQQDHIDERSRHELEPVLDPWGMP